MPVAIPQISFASGEISPSLYGRTDFVRYQTGLKTCRNFIVRPTGGVCNRPGLQFITEVQNSAYQHRLIPFQYNTTQTYVLVFGHLTMRIITNGGVVVYPAGHAHAGEVVEITTIYPATVLSRLKYTQSADVMTICHPDYPPQQLSRTDHHVWTFAAFLNVDGPFQEINTDTTQTLYVSSVTGSTTITAAKSMFTADHIGQMLYIEQSPDSLTKVWEVEKQIYVNDIRRAGVHYYQAVNKDHTGTWKPDHTEGISYDGDSGVAWNYLHSGFGIVLITGYTSATVVTGTVLKRLPEAVLTASASKNIEALTVSDGSTNVAIKITAHGYVGGQMVTVSGVTGTTGANGVWPVVVVDADNIELSGCHDTTAYISGGSVVLALTALPTYKWAFEAWGGDQDYPACVTYYQQRQVFGATSGAPQTTWLSQTKGYLDYGVSNPILDDDAITFTVVSSEVNEVRHFLELSELIALTSAGPWVVKGSQDGVLIPSAISVKRQGMGGSSHVRPIVVDNQALVVIDKGKCLKALNYNIASDMFTGADLTVASRHLFIGRTIEDMAYQGEPFGAAWCVRDDGILLCLTFLPEHEVVGWSHHATDGGTFESVCVVAEGDEDAVYVIVNRTINGEVVRYVERFAERFYTDQRAAFFVDSGLSYDGRNTGSATVTITGGTAWDETESLTLTASAALFASSNVGDQIQFRDEADGIVYRLTITAYSSTTVANATPNRALPVDYQAVARTDWEFAKNVFTGLDHLEGETVSILADGLVQAEQIVSAGTITLERPAAVVHAGLPITADLETLDIYVTGQSIRDRKKIFNHVTFILEETSALWAGPDEDHLIESKMRSTENYDMPANYASGTVDLRIQGTWLKSGHIFVRHIAPLPVSILSVIPEVNIGG